MEKIVRFFAETHKETQVIRTLLSIGFHLIWAKITLQVKSSSTVKLPLEAVFFFTSMLRMPITLGWPTGSFEEP